MKSHTWKSRNPSTRVRNCRRDVCATANLTETLPASGFNIIAHLVIPANRLIRSTWNTCMCAAFCLSSQDSSPNQVNKAWLWVWGFWDTKIQQVLYQDDYCHRENKSEHHCLHGKMNEDIPDNPQDIKKGNKRRGRQVKRETLGPGFPQPCGAQAFLACTVPSWTLLSGVCGWQCNNPKPKRAEKHPEDLWLSTFKGN